MKENIPPPSPKTPEKARNPSRKVANLAQAATLVAYLGAGTVQPVNAENPNTPSVSPSQGSPHLILEQKMPSQQAWENTVQETPAPTVQEAKVTQSKEVKIQAIENPIYFTDSLGRQRKWLSDSATFGIPPNDPNRVVSTTYDYINNSNTWSARFQPKTSLYPEISQGPGVDVIVFGIIADPSTNKAYMATGVMIDNIIYPRFELISDINNPTDYSDGARTVVKDGIGDIAQNGDYDSFYMGSDSQGKYIDIVFIYSVDPSKNGTYRQRLNSQGNFSGSAFKVQQESTPTPTQTSSPTPTHTESPSPTREHTPSSTITPTPSPTATETPPPILTPTPETTATPTPTLTRITQWFKVRIPIIFKNNTGASW